MVNMRPFTAFEQKNLKFLVNHNVKFTQVEITPTGLGKGILDSTAPMRAYFLENGIHNYEEQLQGQEHKQIKQACILTDATQFFSRKHPFIVQTQRKETLECGYMDWGHIQTVMIFMFCFGMNKLCIVSI